MQFFELIFLVQELGSNSSVIFTAVFGFNFVPNSICNLNMTQKLFDRNCFIKLTLVIPEVRF
jgi:hypothetical protein